MMKLKYLQEESTKFWLTNTKTIFEHNFFFFVCAEQRGKETEEGKWESEGRVKERGQKVGEEYGLGNWWKRKQKTKKRGGREGNKKAEFTLGRLAAPQLPASSQIHWDLP